MGLEEEELGVELAARDVDVEPGVLDAQQVKVDEVDAKGEVPVGLAAGDDDGGQAGVLPIREGPAALNGVARRLAEHAAGAGRPKVAARVVGFPGTLLALLAVVTLFHRYLSLRGRMGAAAMVGA